MSAPIAANEDQPAPHCMAGSRVQAELYRHKLGVAAARQRGRDVIDLGSADVRQGPPAELIRQCARNLAEQPEVSLYGEVPGLPPLRAAIADHLAADGTIPAGNVIVTAGANHGVVLALLASVERGAAVALPVPFFFNHAAQIDLLGCRVHPLHTQAADRHALDPASVSAALAQLEVGAALLSDPRNPTATELAPTALEAIGRAATAAGKPLILDESYREFAAVPRPAGWSAHGSVIRVGSFSKSFCLAGWRIGYMIVPDALIEPVLRAQDALMIHPAIISQHMAAAALALRRTDDYVTRLARRVAADRQSLATALRALPWVEGVLTDAGTFLWVRLIDGLDAEETATRLLEECGVGALPGTAFGVRDSLRIGAACVDRDQLGRATERLEAWIA